nr:ATP-binding protein [Azospirillum picis]
MRTHFAGVHGPSLPDGGLPRLARALGLPPAGPEAGGGPLALLLAGPAGADADALWQPPFAAWVEVVPCRDAAEDPGPSLRSLMDAAAAADLYVNVTTATAHDLHLGARLLTALTARCPLAGERRGDVELALHEAISNALVHGNLGVSGMKELSAAELDRFSRDLETRLADPVLAARRIAIAVRLEVGGDGQRAASVDIADEGAGFAPDRGHHHDPRPGSGASGRGLDLIGSIADGLEIADGGRRIRLRFHL